MIKMNETSIIESGTETVQKEESTPTHRIVKNSFWIVAQTLFLNFISIFATAYIARKLGQGDYGKFVFVFSFIGLFGPIVNLGLRTVTVREVAENKNQAVPYVVKMLVLKFILALAAFVLTILAINVMKYPQTTKVVVYFASLTIILNAITSTFKDAFQAFEKMKYIAYVEFISGSILTAMSVIVLFIGYRLIGLTLAYVFGSLLAMLTSALFLFKKFTSPKVHFRRNFVVQQSQIDFPFWRDNIKKGMPFFIPALVDSIGSRSGIIILSKTAADLSMGIFGAANALASRISIIPDSICTAFFPTMASVYKRSREEAIRLFQKFFLYMFLLSIPIAIGITILAKPIINLIYGSRYESAVIVLQILIWSIALGFPNWLMMYTLGAIRHEKKSAKATYFNTFSYLILSLIFVPRFKEVGMAMALLAQNIISFLILRKFIKQTLGGDLISNWYSDVGNIIKKGIKKVKEFGLLAVIIFSSFLYETKKAMRRKKTDTRIGIVVGEFFHKELIGFGGYGMTTKNITDHFNLNNNSFRADVLLSQPLEKYNNEIKRYHNADVIFRPSLKDGYIKNFFKYSKKCSDRNIDLLMTIEYYENYEYSLLALPKTPLVIWIHDPRGSKEWKNISTVSLEVLASRKKGPEEFLNFVNIENKSLQKIIKFSNIFKRKIIFATQAYCLIDRFDKAYGLSGVKKAFLPTPIDTPKLNAATYSSRPSFCFLGRLDPVKRPWIFFELAKRFEKCQFFVAGVTHYPQIMDDIIKGYSNLPNLKFLGLVGGREKEELLKNVWAVVNTSIHEALPVSFLEAFAYYKPIISCQNPDNLADKFGIYTGELSGDGFDKDTIDTFSSAIEKLLSANDERISKGIAGRRYVESIHTFHNFENILKGLVRE